jgi:hypothetical protein
MKPTRSISRRSFLATVAGSAAAGGALLALPGEAGALQTTDSDPSDPVGRGRGGARTGVTDSDPSDPVGRGRGTSGGARAGVTDSDPGDPIGRGRGGNRGGQSQPRGVTDSDPGDPIGRGRGGDRGSRCSDSDPSDPVGNGRNCRPGEPGAGPGTTQPGAPYQTGRRERRYEVCWVDHPSRSNDECNMQTYSEWQITWSDGRVEHDTAESARRRAEMEARGYTARWHRFIVNEW